MGVLLSKIKEFSGPKFIYIKSTSTTKLGKAGVLLPAEYGRVLTEYRTPQQSLGKPFFVKRKTLGFSGRICAMSNLKLFKITSRQLHNKTKLAFILPNIDGAKRIGPHN